MPLEDLDAETQKMCVAFAKVSMHQFWKKVKGGLKNAGDKEEQAAFKALYKSFNMNLGKQLDLFDEAFPDEKKMSKHVAKLQSTLKDYEGRTDDAEIDIKARLALSGAIDMLNAEITRRMKWVKKNVKA